MNFDDVIRKRRMVRNFTDASVSEEALERILYAARHAPSAGNTQGQDLIVVRDADRKRKIAELCHQPAYVEMGFDPFISKASVVIIPCTNELAYHQRYQQPDKVQDGGSEIEWPVPYWFMDVGCAVMGLLLAAVNEGLAASFAGFKNLNGARAVFNIPQNVTPVGVIPIGHPAPDKKSPSLKRGRRPAEEVIHHETW